MCVLACALKVKSNPCVRSSPGGKVHGEGSFRNEGETAHQRGGGGGETSISVLDLTLNRDVTWAYHFNLYTLWI